MDWVKSFYTLQNQWSGVYNVPVDTRHHDNARLIARHTGTNHGHLLELGAGGGQNAIASAEQGFQVVAVELVESAVAHAQTSANHLSAEQIRFVNGDFYTITLNQTFDVIAYWDGFGIGTDADQQRLLQRIAGWLKPTGIALIETWTPWYWQKAAGRAMSIGTFARRYGYDAENQRMLDTWWSADAPEQAVTQSLRCYAPAELKQLLVGTGLRLDGVEPRGAYYPERQLWDPNAPLEEAMSYLARIVLV